MEWENKPWRDGKESPGEIQRREEACRGGRGRRGEEAAQSGARSHSLGAPRAMRVCSVGAE